MSVSRQTAVSCEVFMPIISSRGGCYVKNAAPKIESSKISVSISSDFLKLWSLGPSHIGLALDGSNADSDHFSSR
jgi:hypothetical protein